MWTFSASLTWLWVLLTMLKLEVIWERWLSRLGNLWSTEALKALMVRLWFFIGASLNATIAVRWPRRMTKVLQHVQSATHPNAQCTVSYMQKTFMIVSLEAIKRIASKEISNFRNSWKAILVTKRYWKPVKMCLMHCSTTVSARNWNCMHSRIRQPLSTLSNMKTPSIWHKYWQILQARLNQLKTVNRKQALTLNKNYGQLSYMHNDSSRVCSTSLNIRRISLEHSASKKTTRIAWC